MSDKNKTSKPKSAQKKAAVSTSVVSPVAVAPALPNKMVAIDKLEESYNEILKQTTLKKNFSQTFGNCGGGIPNSSTRIVDLVVLIDTSGSMRNAANDLSAKAEAAIKDATSSCPSDLRVSYFGIEGTWPSTRFSQSYRKHLHSLGVKDADLLGRLESKVGEKAKEDGAAAVVDISKHFDWRTDASRIIFYLGDEALKGGTPHQSDDIAAANTAIAEANTQNVRVFTYFDSTSKPDVQSEYARLATETSGQGFVAPVSNIGGFETILKDIICSPILTPNPCQIVQQPEIAPCLHLHWGDGKRDQIETDDVEILLMSVVNPYSNIEMRDFTLHLEVTQRGGGAVPMLPDGTPSVELKPEYMISFGDIPPCNGNANPISRELVLRTRGAAIGMYPIKVTYSFEACFTYLETKQAFELELVSS